MKVDDAGQICTFLSLCFHKAEAKTAFEAKFAEEVFGPRVARFDSVAHETASLTEMSRVAQKSLIQRFGPYMGRHNAESVDLGGNVVVYEVPATSNVRHFCSISTFCSFISLLLVGFISQSRLHHCSNCSAQMSTM